MCSTQEEISNAFTTEFRSNPTVSLTVNIKEAQAKLRDIVTRESGDLHCRVTVWHNYHAGMELKFEFRYMLADGSMNVGYIYIDGVEWDGK